MGRRDRGLRNPGGRVSKERSPSNKVSWNYKSGRGRPLSGKKDLLFHFLRRPSCFLARAKWSPSLSQGSR